MEATITKLFGRNRQIAAWYLYDFGNSAYAAVVLLAVYSAYFKGTVVGGAEGSRLWGLSVGIAMLFVAVTAPILGAIADHSALKKRFLLVYTVISCFFTSMLFFVGKGDIFFGMLFFILAEIGYRSAQVFYNAMLPDIAPNDEIGRISGNGWAIGSLGGIICLLIILPAIVLVGGELIVRLSLAFTALFFAVSTLPLLFWYKEETFNKEYNILKANYLLIGYKQIKKTIKSISRYKEFVKFLIAFLIYNDGIIMALNFAAIIGAVLYGLTQEQLIIFMIIVQIASVAGAYIFGIIAHKNSLKNSLIGSLILMIGAVFLLFINQSLTGFFFIGALAGFSLTGTQSVSRSMVGVLSPKGQSAEFFGFFGVAGRTSSFIGPAVFGWIAAETTIRLSNSGLSLFSAEQLGHRYAILSIIVFLIIGLVFLISVDEKHSSSSGTNTNT